MDPVFKHLLILLVVVWTAAVLLRRVGLPTIFGELVAGLFFREEVANKELIQKVEDRLYGISYSFLGPIFFISLGFHVTFEAILGNGLWLLLALTGACAVGQVVSAGGMALVAGFSRMESLTIGVGMMGRAEMAFVLASIGFHMEIISSEVFSILLFTTFLLNLLTILGIKVCALKLAKIAPDPRLVVD
jgi:Kef-type K+ transport system membrane component KefB